MFIELIIDPSMQTTANSIFGKRETSIFKAIKYFPVNFHAGEAIKSTRNIFLCFYLRFA